MSFEAQSALIRHLHNPELSDPTYSLYTNERFAIHSNLSNPIDFLIRKCRIGQVSLHISRLTISVDLSRYMNVALMEDCVICNVITLTAKCPFDGTVIPLLSNNSHILTM